MSRQEEPSSKRRRHHPLQRRFLTVPSSSLDELEDVYDGGNEDLWQGILCQSRRPRPFASSQILSSTIMIGTTNDPNGAPLLQDFFQAVGMTKHSKAAAAEDDETTTKDDEAQKLQELDNPALSQLTVGQHRRYLQLTSGQQTDRRTEAERKEVRTLKQFVKSEQQAYREALKQFYAANKDRFLIGFTTAASPAAAFCRWASSHGKTRNQQLVLKMPKTFGKCRQVISLPALSASSSLDIQGLGDFEIVHRSSEDTPCPITMTEIGSDGRRSIPAPNCNNVPKTFLLRDDATALRLAKQHKASIVTTAETLETLLLLPGDYMSRWMVYATTMATSTSTTTTTDDTTRLVLLDIPIAQPFLAPRACLERGIQEGLYQYLTATATEMNNNNTPPPVQYIYTLWTLPQQQQRRRRQQVRILVRSNIRLVQKNAAANNNGNTTTPVQLRSHLEYFPERGMEVPTSYEKALWILDQLLLQHQVSTRLCRVSPRTCNILAWEEISVAHAFCDDGDSPLVLHYPALLQILQSIPIIDIESCCLLCCSPTSLSVSVHAPEDNASGVVVIDLGPILEQADAVVLSEKALSQCPRDWKWEATDRVPSTFPVREPTKK